MVPEYTGTAAQGFGCGARTARSGSVRARSCRVTWLVQAGALAKARQWQWCRQGLWRRLWCGWQWRLGWLRASLWEGEYEVTKWPTPSPLFIGLMRQPKSPLPPFFAIIANLGFSLHHHMHFKIFSLNINKIRNENYYNKN